MGIESIKDWYKRRKMKIRINDAKGKLKLGDWVRTNSTGSGRLQNPPVVGEIGEIDEDAFYIWQNTIAVSIVTGKQIGRAHV